MPGRGLGVVCLDLTGDGWVDFYVANDGEANQLWVNQTDGTFSEEAIVRGLAFNTYGQPEGSMGIAVGISMAICGQTSSQPICLVKRTRFTSPRRMPCLLI